MSFTSNHSTEPGRPAKKRIQRRHGACEPCRSSKTKCDGRLPCGACRSERRRQCPCTYSEKVMKLQQVTAEMRRRAEQERMGLEVPVHQPSPSGSHEERVLGHDLRATSTQDHSKVDLVDGSRVRNASEEKVERTDVDPPSSFERLSLCGTIDEFKSLKVAKGSALQVLSRCNGLEAIDSSTSAPNTSNKSTKISDLKPRILDFSTSIAELSSLKDRLDTVWSSVIRGRLRRAWVDLASLVREAELFESPESLKQMADDDRTSWKQLWTNILDLESQLGLALGRPTYLDLPKQGMKELDMDVATLKDADLDATRLDLYQHIQSVLSLDPRSLTVSSDFHDKAKAILEYEPFHKVGLCITEDHSTSARDLQLNTHLFFMVLYCRLASMSDVHAREGKAPILLGTESADTSRSLNLNQPRIKLTYCRMMFKSAKFVVKVFLNLMSDESDETRQSWMRCHNVLIAATLLGIAKLRHEVEWDPITELLRKLEQAFSNLARLHPDCDLFKVAINRLQDLNSVKEPASEVIRNKHSGIKHRKRHVTNSTETSPVRRRGRDMAMFSDTGSNASSPSRSLKRTREQMEDSTPLTRSLDTSFNSAIGESDEIPPLSAVSTSFDGSIDQTAYYHDDSTLFSQTNSFVSDPSSSTATSFCESEPGLPVMPDIGIPHPGPPFAYPFPYEIVHPPMMLYNPTMLVGEQVLVSSPMGVQFFQAPPDLEPSHTVLRSLNPISPAQTLDSTSHLNQHRSRAIGTMQMFHTTHDQQQLAKPGVTPGAEQLLSPPSSLKVEPNLKPGVSRRHSTETVRLASGSAPIPAISRWNSPQRIHTIDCTLQDDPQATGVDDAEQIFIRDHEHQPTTPHATAFYMPMARSSLVSLPSTPQPIYQLSIPTEAGAQPGSFYAHPVASTAEIRHFHQNCGFSVHGQQEHVQGQDQWRHMSVNAGVP